MADVGDLDRPADRPAAGFDLDHQFARVDIQLGAGREVVGSRAEPGVEPLVGRAGASSRRHEVGSADRGQERRQPAETSSARSASQRWAEAVRKSSQVRHFGPPGIAYENGPDIGEGAGLGSPGASACRRRP